MSLAAAIEPPALISQSAQPALAAEHAPPTCSYCGSHDFAPLYGGIRDRLGFVPGEWSFVRCADCGSAQLRPFPRAEDLGAFYPPVYTFSPELAKSTLQRLLATLEYRLFFRPMYRAQVRLVDRRVRERGQKPGRLLDLGCGRGLRLVDFRDRGYDVRGMDFVPDAVSYVRETLGIPAVCTTPAGLPDHYEPESFDVITAFHVVEHLTDPDVALAAVHRLLKPGGWLAIAGPLLDSLQARSFGARWTAVTEAPRHVTIPSRAGLKKLCIAAGFDPTSLAVAPDAALSCSSVYALSKFPSGASTAAYGTARKWAAATRILAAAATLLAAPLAWFENHIGGRPALGIVFARKPLRSLSSNLSSNSSLS
ncbi:MAG: class I SAM-dependent methyltransferase [Pirellulaceae bacterium]|nr:class I SAM-dependent methyltransferase [Pirellulaceae bacterium]